jgi:hypothetical protein
LTRKELKRLLCFKLKEIIEEYEKLKCLYLALTKIIEEINMTSDISLGDKIKTGESTICQ